ncbi:MAG: hypothetical protein U0414_39455 [Polyangiaceae bacterium]
MALMVGAQIVGTDATVAWAGARGDFELNVMMPVIAHNVLFATHVAASALRQVERRVRGIAANEARVRGFVERSAAMVTALAPRLGYDRASELGREAARSGRTVREVALAESVADAATLNELLDSRKLTG